MKEPIKYRFFVSIFLLVSIMHLSVNVLSQVKEKNINCLIKTIETVGDLDSVNTELCATIKNIFLEIEQKGLSDNVESDTMFELVQLIYNKSLSANRYILLLIELDDIIRRNAELGQYLSELQHKIALQNTKGFVQVYESLPIETKKKVKGNLNWLIEYDYQQIFIDKLDSLNDNQQKVILELKSIMD